MSDIDRDELRESLSRYKESLLRFSDHLGPTYSSSSSSDHYHDYSRYIYNKYDCLKEKEMRHEYRPNIRIKLPKKKFSEELEEIKEDLVKLAEEVEEDKQRQAAKSIVHFDPEDLDI